MIVELFLFAAILLFYLALKDRKPQKMPPGPPEIPFIGNKPIETVEQLEDLRKNYGKIVTTRIGNNRTVTISDYKMAKDMMASIEVADRPLFFRSFTIHPDSHGGVVSANGIPWLHDRRFVLRHLRDLGMGKTHLEIAIHDEARALVEHLKSFEGKPIYYPMGLRTAVLNVIWQLVAGKRYDLTSKEVDAIFDTIESFRKDASTLLFAETFFPILQACPSFLKNQLFKTYVLERFREEMARIIDTSIEEHKNELDENNPKDLIDDYLIELQKSKDDQNSTFSIPSLYEIVSDLFGAGSDTVTNMLRWVVFFMVKYPDVTRRAQMEIDEVAGNQLVSILDKARLPYIEAYTTEALRHVSLAFMNVQRATSKDIEVDGYLLPKGTTVAVNNYHIHHDPQFWDDPHTFKPERFLDSEGKFQAKKGRVFAFGSGRRQCLGESLARMEFFLFTSAILQNFTIEKPPGTKLDEGVNDSLGIRVINDQLFTYKIRRA